VLEVRHGSDAREERMAEPIERVDASAETGFEAGLQGELVAESQQLETRTGVVEEKEAIAESIGETFGVPGNETRGLWRGANRRTRCGGGRCHATVTADIVRLPREDCKEIGLAIERSG
jgi:hypothetical protein